MIYLHVHCWSIEALESVGTQSLLALRLLDNWKRISNNHRPFTMVMQNFNKQIKNNSMSVFQDKSTTKWCLLYLCPRHRRLMRKRGKEKVILCAIEPRVVVVRIPLSRKHMRVTNLAVAHCSHHIKMNSHAQHITFSAHPTRNHTKRTAYNLWGWNLPF